MHVDAQGIGTFLAHGHLDGLRFDADGLASHWRLDRQGGEMTVEATIDVQSLSLKRGWGGPMWPRSRHEYSVFPLVLDAQVRIRRGQDIGRPQRRGLAEDYDAETWRTA